MTKNKKAVVTIVATAILIYMFRKKIAAYLNTTPFGAVSDKLFNIISNLEGFDSVAKWDFKQWSIGYGSGWNWDKNRAVQKGDVIDKATAKQWLLNEAEKNFNFVRSIVTVPINDNQLAALSSFAYNTGNGALASSTLLKLLNTGSDKVTVANEFDKWIYAGGTVNAGLKNRRKAEKTLFLA